MRLLSHSRRLSFTGALVLWTALVLFGIFAGLHLGYGGQRFAVAIFAAGLLLAAETFAACPLVGGRLATFLASRVFFLAATLPLVAFLAYALSFYPADWLHVSAGVLFIIAPALLAADGRGQSAGTFGDYLALFIIWLPVQFHWIYRLWPYPPPLTHTLTILFAVSVALMAFLFMRRLDGIGYVAEWRSDFGATIAWNFLLPAVMIIPLGEAIHFIRFGPTMRSLGQTPLAGLEILIFTAWPEEFLFRGLLQNLLSRSLKNRYAGWIAASVIFGFAHILHEPTPNWKYVCLATIAGLFYGRAWMKTGSLVPGTIIHALVDSVWFAFFPR